MKLYIIAGEASGDLHASNLIKALKKKQADLEVRAWGGDKMEAAGATIVRHYRDLAFMGFVEVVRNLRTILGNLRFCKADIQRFKPDALVLIDYPGFNLRIAKWAKINNIKVIYYISPQIWAWHRSRVKAIRRDVDKMLVILPFEPDFYKTYGVDASFVGHPLLDAMEGMAQDETTATLKKQICLLPGSRRQEIEKILPQQLSVVKHFPDYTFVLAAAEGLPPAFIEAYLTAYPQVSLVRGETYSVLKNSSAALVKSGTSTLETALIGVPQVVCYAGNPLSYWIAKRLVNIRFISLVNLILDKALVRELIQHELREDLLVEALHAILSEPERSRIKEGYRELRLLLGGGGASERAAFEILEALK